MTNVSSETLKSWVIALICCIINFLHLGIARQSGLLYMAAIARYDANRNQASLPFVLCYTVRNVSGPFVGFLGRKVGLERVTIFGCVLASIGMGACFFAEDILTVTVLWGGVFGLGFGMGSVLIPVVLNQHFDKHFTNANGIAFGGECVAGFILPIFVKTLLNEFGTSGLFLILSGLMLHSLPAALLLELFSKELFKSPAYKPVSVNHDPSNVMLFTTANRMYNKYFNVDGYGKTCHADSTNFSNDSNSITTTNKMLKENNYMHDNLESENNIGSFAGAHYQKNIDSESLHYKYTPNILHKQRFNEVTAPPATIKYPNTIQNGNKCQKREPLFPTSRTEKLSSAEPSKISASSSFRVFYDPAFILMLLTQSSFIFIATMVSTIIVDLSRDAGVTSNEEIYILMCLSVSDLIGRFGLGWVTDSNYMSTVAFSAVCYSSLGIALTALVFLKGFVLIMCAALCIGLFLGGLLIVCPGVVSDHIEKEKITMALASRFVLYAPISLTQSPLIGFFRGTKGSYNGILYILTAVCFLCCVMSLSIPFAARLRERRKRTKIEINEKDKTMLKFLPSPHILHSSNDL